ncbi:MAG: glycosyltransferase family 2 protein [Verrucomicrobiota bacterium]
MEENGEPTSLFVVHWNRPAECVGTVQSLLAQGINLRVTVIDNHSSPEALCVLRSGLDPGIEILKLAENKGWGPALNVALQQWLSAGGSPWCFISAHDAVPAPDCLSLLLQAAENDERVGIACPQYPDETVARFSARRGVYQDHGTPLSRGAPQMVDVPHGTLMLVKRTCLAEIGLFDERYFAYGDEHELGVRAVRRGWKVALVWGAIVTNPGTWTASPLRSYLFTRNSLLLVHDYCGKLPAFVRAILILVNTLRLLIFSPPRAFAFSPKARLRAVWDYAVGRHGRPTFNTG